MGFVPRFTAALKTKALSGITSLREAIGLNLRTSNSIQINSRSQRKSRVKSCLVIMTKIRSKAAGKSKYQQFGIVCLGIPITRLPPQTLDPNHPPRPHQPDNPLNH